MSEGAFAGKSGWQIYADTFSREPRVQWPALMMIAAQRADTALKRRRAYWRRKAVSLRNDCERKGYLKPGDVKFLWERS